MLRIQQITGMKLNIQLRILLATNAMILMSVAMIGPIYAIFVEKVGGDLLDASIAGSLLALAAGITTFISGKYSDNVKENELIVVLGYFIIGTSYLLYIWVNSVMALFAVQILIGLGEAIYSPAFDAVYSKHLDGNHSGSQWGAWESMNYLTASVGAFVGGIIVTAFGFNVLFATMSGLCFCSAIYIYHLKRNIL